VVEVLGEHRFGGRAIVSCFDLAPLEAVRAADAELLVGIILTAAKGDVSRLPVNFLSLNRRLVRPDLVRRAHERGMEVHVWTVNDRGAALALVEMGCDNLITSNPVLVREVVDEYVQLSDVARVLLRLRRWIRR
jgi:glycerophosphoryl diester phosphodiesterase